MNLDKRPKSFEWTIGQIRPLHMFQQTLAYYYYHLSNRKLYFVETNFGSNQKSNVPKIAKCRNVLCISCLVSMQGLHDFGRWINCLNYFIVFHISILFLFLFVWAEISWRLKARQIYQLDKSSRRCSIFSH